MEPTQLLEQELKGSLDFFQDFTNLDHNSRGFGLTVDSTKTPRLASIASVGFALTAWVIACDRGYLSRPRALEITRGTLSTLLCHASQHRGFFAHFLDMQTAHRHRTCEYSTIDTALCLNGVITAAAYYQDSEISALAEQLLARVDWYFLIFKRWGKLLLRMAYNPDFDGDYANGQAGLISQWSMAAEQKMMYLQAAGSLPPEVARSLYHGFARDTGLFEGREIIVNPGGNLFAYQFSEAWLDTRKYLDPDGIDWFENTRLAILADRSFCMEHAGRYKTYHANSWGLSGGDSPSGYDVAGATPCLEVPHHNGTVVIGSAIASLPFTPGLSLELMLCLRETQPKTWGKYGFFDAYNLDTTPPWYSHAIYGINKGCELIMIENYLTGLIWEVYTSSPIIQSALQVLGFTLRKGEQDEQVLPAERAVLAG